MTRLILFSDDLLHPEEEVAVEVHHRAVADEEVRLLDEDHQDVGRHHQEGMSYDDESLNLFFVILDDDLHHSVEDQEGQCLLDDDLDRRYVVGDLHLVDDRDHQ